MGKQDIYVIGGRFIVEWRWVEPLSIKDREGRLHSLFGVDPLKARYLRVYKGDTVYWVLEDVQFGETSKGRGNVVIKGNGVISYSGLVDDHFYIYHYGQDFLGGIKIGKGKDILMYGNYLEVRKTRKDDVYLTYRSLGDRVTPLITVGGKGDKVVCLPELNRVYRGEKIYVNECWECLNIWIFRDNMLSLYVLLRDGEEFLVYAGRDPGLHHLPELHRIGGKMIVRLKYRDELEFVKELRRIPGFDYVYFKEDLKLGGDKKLGQSSRSIFDLTYPSLAALKEFAKPLLAEQKRLPSFERLS